MMQSTEFEPGTGMEEQKEKKGRGRKTRSTRGRADATKRSRASSKASEAAAPEEAGRKAPRRKATRAPLPIQGYESLGVTEIKKHLTSLSRGDLRKIRTFEQRNRNRKGLISEIERSLQGGKRETSAKGRSSVRSPSRGRAKPRSIAARSPRRARASR